MRTSSVTHLETKQMKSSSIITLLALAMGFIMATLDVTVVNVAVADIRVNLHMGISSATWIVDGYMLSFASLLLIGGSLANRYGAKYMYLVGLVCFVLASLFCSIASSGNILIVSRILQGVGAALFMPSSLSLLAASYPNEKQRAKMFGLWSAIVSVASGIGPFVGGVLVHTLGWRSIFIINLPIGIIGILLAYYVIPISSRQAIKLNLFNHGLGVITLASLAFSLIEGPSYGWTAPQILSGFLITIIAASLFIIAERNAKQPIIPFSLFYDQRFSSANIVGFLINFALFGGIFMFGLFLQHARGATPFLAGLQLLPMMAVFVVGNLLFAKLANRFGSKLPMLISLFIASFGSFVLTFISPHTPYWMPATIYSIVNLGIGVSVPAMTTIVMQSAGREHGNIAGATLNVNRQVGALVGVAIMSIILHSSGGWYEWAKYSFLTMGTSYLLAGFLVSYFIKK
ncbi:MFS transporter [Bacillus pseudomycoides]|uniref:MFS transporter n=1 Tax=Bacillus pseudomycoides TaxID=64104 RepID=A0AA91V7I0_9BACI|nr:MULTISPECIES: MFS transporter [Bacillus]PEB50227.1 MFS transporter [Bacillus sp. AFS098217]PED80038.1 MFS transporter [Bacillus pseudomycoides]PEU16581.1 MFS transporter [Bacillus sp. AFS019443]PEU18923.1 MFS transporter [Bacillus sp. AFS014408]PFW65346.1 MFS transporter [Bacillus sp. AFS075034]